MRIHLMKRICDCDGASETLPRAVPLATERPAGQPGHECCLSLRNVAQACTGPIGAHMYALRCIEQRYPLGAEISHARKYHTTGRPEWRAAGSRQPADGQRSTLGRSGARVKLGAGVLWLFTKLKARRREKKALSLLLVYSIAFAPHFLNYLDRASKVRCPLGRFSANGVSRSPLPSPARLPLKGFANGSGESSGQFTASNLRVREGCPAIRSIICSDSRLDRCDSLRGVGRLRHHLNAIYCPPQPRPRVCV